MGSANVKNLITKEATRAIENREQKIFKVKDLDHAIDTIRQIQNFQENGEWNQDLLKSLSVFFETYFSIEKTYTLRYDLIWNYQREAGQSLSKSKSISVICKVIMEGFKNTHQFNVISQSLHTLVNYSDCTPEVTSDIALEPNFLETIKGILTSHMQKEAKVKDDKAIEWCLAIYYNVSTVDDNFPRLRSLDIVPVFSSFLHAKHEIYRLIALSTLANIIDEKESAEILQGKPDVIAFLLKKLGLALKDTRHKHLGWSAQKCARTVCSLARNDANKTLLVQKGCLPHLVELAKIGIVEEKREAVGAIQILSLKKDNHSMIVDDTRLKIVDMLKEIKEESSDKEIRKAVEITFWNLREKLEKNNNYKHLVPKSNESHGASIIHGKGPIMISYEQSNQEVLIKIRDILKEDYVVCMNNDNTIEVMAKAVEEAHVFLMCMSRKYKDDPSCKAEAEYAFQQKKKIIPLVMEKGYKADGWLGFLVGARLFFDFSGKYPFEEKIKDLKHEIANSYRD